MGIDEILLQVKQEFKNASAKITHVDAKRRIMELFVENGIDEEKYDPTMGNNILPDFPLK